MHSISYFVALACFAFGKSLDLRVGMTWDYHLKDTLTYVNDSIDVYDVDLYETSQAQIDDLHNNGKYVICYFSAGSFEEGRPDSDEFLPRDIGNLLDGWEDELWLNISSPEVRDIMRARILLAANKSCDAIEPDNVDGYDNETGFNLTEGDSISFVKFLSELAHGSKMKIGLKNSGSIVNEVINYVQFSVQEQCIEYDECDLYSVFISQEKPVFHVEYPNEESNSLNLSTVEEYCGNDDSIGFSSILKNLDLGDWLFECSRSSDSGNYSLSTTISRHPLTQTSSRNLEAKNEVNPIFLAFFLFSIFI